MRSRCKSATDQNNHDGFCPLRNSDLEKLGKGVVLLMESSILMDARTDRRTTAQLKAGLV